MKQTFSIRLSFGFSFSWLLALTHKGFHALTAKVKKRIKSNATLYKEFKRLAAVDSWLKCFSEDRVATERP